MKPLLTTLVIFLLNIFSSSAFDVSYFNTAPSSGSVLVNGENVTVNFFFEKYYSNDVTIYVRPFSDGSLASNYGASGGVLISGTSGTGTSTFTITSGVEQVDAIRFTVVDADSGAELDVIFKTVDFEFVPHQISNISFDKPSGSTLVHSEQVNVTFDYASSHDGDVRLYVFPYSNGTTSPDSRYNPSGLYSTPRGSGSGYFRIASGEVLVDQVKILIQNEDNSNVLHEEVVDVSYEYVPHLISNISFDKPSGSTLVHSEQVNVTFDYASSHDGDVRLYVFPYSNGTTSPDSRYNPSGLYSTPRGSGSGYFRIASGDVTVDQVKIVMQNEDNSNVLHEKIIQNSYDYTSFYVVNLSYLPAPGSILQIDEFVNIDFGYKTSETGDFKVRAIPFNGGSEIGDYDSPASMVYSSSDGDGSVQFSLGSEGTQIDQIRFELVSSDEAFVLGTHMVDAQFSTETVTSLEDEVEDGSGISVFPIPARGNQIVLKSTDEKGHYYLIDMNRKVISQGTFGIGNNPVSIDNFSSGVYILKTVTGEGEETRKVVVQ